MIINHTAEPKLNPIEKLFLIFKTKFKALRLKEIVTREKVDHHQEVRNILDSITISTIRGLISNARRMWSSTTL